MKYIRKYLKMNFADILLTLTLVLCGFASLIIFYKTSRTGTSLVIRQNGVITATYPLNEDAMINVSDSGNVITIKNGAATMTEADCPDLICVRHKSIKRTGETIVCLPHQLSLSVEGGVSVDDDKIDAIAR